MIIGIDYEYLAKQNKKQEQKKYQKTILIFKNKKIKMGKTIFFSSLIFK
tara:strand:+ start:546 stop:692 length:147 start_codon:yes stop_codon:yes gene_type:complete